MTSWDFTIFVCASFLNAYRTNTDAAFINDADIFSYLSCRVTRAYITGLGYFANNADRIETRLWSYWSMVRLYGVSLRGFASLNTSWQDVGAISPSPPTDNMSCGDCLEGKRGDYLTSSVLLCIIIVHITSYAHLPIYWAVRTRSTGSGVDLAWLSCLSSASVS